MAQKTYYCEYYRVKSINNNGENLFDLLSIINEIDIEDYEQNAKRYRDDYVRIEDIHYDQNSRLWFFRFVRIRDKDMPLLCTLTDATTELSLEEGQLIAEPMVCLYDSEHSILMVQKNSDSVSPVGIREYFNEFVEEEIIIDQIVNPNAISRIRRSEKTTKIRVRLAEVNRMPDQDEGFFQTTFGRIIQSMDAINIPYIELTLSVGSYRSREIAEEDARDLLNVVESNPEGFDKVEYTVREEGKSQLINLFYDVIKDKMTFELPENGVLRFDVVRQKMSEIYAGTRENTGRVNQLLNILP